MALPRSTTTNEDAETGETVVGPAISIRGRIEGEEDLRVEGRVEGSISLTETLYVEPGGVVLAQIEARDVVISGIVIGDISAANSVTLNKAAKLVGNISAPRIIIADGASFRGDMVMDGEDFPAARERTRATSTVPRGAIGGAPAARTTSSSSSSSGTRNRSASGSYESRGESRTSTPPRREAQSAAPARVVTPAPARRPALPAAAPAAAAPAATRRPGEDDDDTVVIKHAALRKGEAPPEEEDDESNPRRRRAKKSARMPVRGRTKVQRR
jgi:cytoskeletal protein CcmA (bactofilin family)